MNCFGISDIGLVRETNQDSFFYGYNENHEFIALVCDGIGGGKAGDVASKIAIDSLKASFLSKKAYKSDVRNKQWINEAIKKANDEIYLDSLTSRKKHGMGTTLVGVFHNGDSTLLFHMGDSRAYGFYDTIVCLTEDHNLITDLIKSGEVSEQEALQHPKGKALTNALGIWSQYRVEINKVKKGYSYLLLCSDGLHGYVQEIFIKDVVLNETLSLENKCKELIESAIKTGGFDNITVVIVEGKRGIANE